MIFRTLSSIICVAIGIWLNSCVTDISIPAERQGYLNLTVERASLAEVTTKVQESTPEKIRNVVITVQDHEGNDTDYTLRTLELYEFQGHWLIERIDLPAGAYQITTLHLTDTTANILYAAPEDKAPLAKYVRQTLPLSFHVENNSEKAIKIEVISTDHFSPKDFGFDPNLVHFQETFFFFVSLVKTKVDEFMEFLPGEITVSSGEYNYKKSVDAGVQKVTLQKGLDPYHIQIESDQYATYEHVFSYDSLLLFRSNPLIIEFQRNTGAECVGGSHQGDVILLTQDDVVNFGKRCYTHIEGSLQIGNFEPNSGLRITDLSPLETLTEISKDLRIINNPDLTSLMGLQYLQNAENVRLESNNSLSSFYGLRRLRFMYSFASINNSSLTHTDGLPWNEVVVEDLHIEGSHTLQNLGNMKELTGAKRITIRNNPQLAGIDLPSIPELSSLTIEGNKSLISLTGFNNSIRSLWNLRINNNPLLEDLQGMLAPEAAIYGTVIINKNAALANFNGLKFSERVTRLAIDSNPSLQDISVLSDVHQIFLYLEITNNDQLESLAGLENLLSVGDPDRVHSVPVRAPDLSIMNNKSLTDFCALTSLFEHAAGFEWEFDANAFNPTLSDFHEGNCAL